MCSSLDESIDINQFEKLMKCGNIKAYPMKQELLLEFDYENEN